MIKTKFFRNVNTLTAYLNNNPRLTYVDIVPVKDYLCLVYVELEETDGE